MQWLFLLLAVGCTQVAEPYDPLAVARASIGHSANLEPSVPPQCYARTTNGANPCWVCHTEGTTPNTQDDADLQADLTFSDYAKTNHWTNLFADRSREVAAISDEEVLRWVRDDNYSPLRAALEQDEGYRGYVPDLDFAQGFDDEGFARDGSGWRAFRYHPLPGFWPSEGSTDDAFIRLPAALRATPEQAIANYGILERAIGGDERTPLPERYVGSTLEVRRYVYPEGTELLHSVRYVDPDEASQMATRMKELRYARKVNELDAWAINRAYEREHDEKDEGHLPVYPGSPLVGLRTFLGWQLQGFIEDEQGRLRLQTEEEHRYCMGCHSALGATVDGTFSFARKVPGDDGWRPQDLRGLRDVPEVGHDRGELATWFERLGRPRAIATLDELFPTPERALELDKAYLAIVRAQSFRLGRDPTITPSLTVHARVDETATGLRVHPDGRLQLAFE